MKRQGGLFVRDGRTGKEGGVEGHHTSVLPSDRRMMYGGDGWKVVRPKHEGIGSRSGPVHCGGRGVVTNGHIRREKRGDE